MITEEQYLELQARGLRCAQERRQMRHFERRAKAVREMAVLLSNCNVGEFKYNLDTLMLACGLRGDGSP